MSYLSFLMSKNKMDLSLIILIINFCITVTRLRDVTRVLAVKSQRVEDETSSTCGKSPRIAFWDMTL